jgi:hypothetical protein
LGLIPSTAATHGDLIRDKKPVPVARHKPPTQALSTGTPYAYGVSMMPCRLAIEDRRPPIDARGSRTVDAREAPHFQLTKRREINVEAKVGMSVPMLK